MATTNQKDGKLHSLLDSFLRDTSNTRQQDRSTLIEYLKQRPIFSAPTDLVPAEEIEQRLDFMLDVQNLIRESEDPEWFPSAVHVATFMAIPTDSLRALRECYRMLLGHGWLGQLARIHELTLHFFQNLSKEQKEALGQYRPSPASKASGNNSPSGEPGPSRPGNAKNDKGKKRKLGNQDEDYSPNNCGDGSIKRDEKERKKCLNRDGNSCLITGVAHPEACHILPFAFNSNEQNRRISYRLVGTAGNLFGDDIGFLTGLVAQGVGSTDKVWNMLSLSPQIHDWWGRGLLGFKCLGVIPGVPLASIRLQIRWMCPASLKQESLNRPVDLGIERETVVEKITDYSRPFEEPMQGSAGGLVSVARASSSRRVLSGDVIDIKIGEKDAFNMKAMLDIQWALVSILGMSGAACSPELLGEPEGPDNGASQVHQWLSNVEASEKAPPAGEQTAPVVAEEERPSKASRAEPHPPQPDAHHLFRGFLGS